MIKTGNRLGVHFSPLCTYGPVSQGPSPEATCPRSPPSQTPRWRWDTAGWLPRPRPLPHLCRIHHPETDKRKYIQFKWPNQEESLIQLYSQFSVHTSICKSLQSKQSVLQIIQRSWVFVRGQIGDELFMNQNVFVLSIALRFSTPPFFWEGWQQKSANNNSARNHHLVTGGELSFWGGWVYKR